MNKTETIAIEAKYTPPTNYLSRQKQTLKRAQAPAL
jgi:hypothetical protein